MEYNNSENEISEIIFNNKEKDVLLIADNNEIKTLINNFFPHFKIICKDITVLKQP